MDEPVICGMSLNHTGEGGILQLRLGESIIINGVVDGDVEVDGGNVTIIGDGVVTGNVTCKNGATCTCNRRAQVQGDVIPQSQFIIKNCC